VNVLIDLPSYAQFVAVRWVNYGPPWLLWPEDSFPEYLGISREQVRDLLYTDEGSAAMYEASTYAQHVTLDYAMMPPIPPDTVRINHTFGLRTSGDQAGERQRFSLLRRILREGLVPQPAGQGKYSELPTAVFGVVDAPGQGENRLYNKHFPWIVADVPIAFDPWTLRDRRPGSVVVLPTLPAEFIVGINGVPVDFFMAGLHRWGPVRRG
jgi:hypothetical protein